MAILWRAGATGLRPGPSLHLEDFAFNGACCAAPHVSGGAVFGGILTPPARTHALMISHSLCNWKYRCSTGGGRA